MKTPIALWLADKLDEEIQIGGNKAALLMINTAAELRRLHKANQELIEIMREMLFDSEGKEWIDSDMDELAWDMKMDKAHARALAAVAKDTGTKT